MLACQVFGVAILASSVKAQSGSGPSLFPTSVSLQRSFGGRSDLLATSLKSTILDGSVVMSLPSPPHLSTEGQIHATVVEFQFSNDWVSFSTPEAETSITTSSGTSTFPAESVISVQGLHESAEITAIADIVFSADGERLLSASIKLQDTMGGIEVVDSSSAPLTQESAPPATTVQRFMVEIVAPELSEDSADVSHVIYELEATTATIPINVLHRQIATEQFSNLMLDVQMDAEFVAAHGGSCNGAIERAQSILALVNTEYSRDVGFSWIAAGFLCDQAGVVYPASAGTTVEALLQEVQTNRAAVIAGTANSADMSTRATTDVAHLLTGKDTLQGQAGGAVGLSLVGTACTGGEYAISLTFSDFKTLIAQRSGEAAPDTDASLAGAADDMAHELGHTLGAQHCAGSCPYTMNPAIISALQFGSDTITEIDSYRTQTTSEKACYCDKNSCST